MNTIERHRAAIKGGVVTRTNVIGIRKLLNAAFRQSRGWPAGRMARIDPADLQGILDTLANRKPRVAGTLHETGLKLLRSPRNKRKVATVADMLPTIRAFRLVGFDMLDNGNHVPVYRADCKAGQFTFRNIPWQSGGDGPEVLQVNE